MKEKSTLEELTQELIEAAEYLLKVFYKVKETGEQEDFYETVRPYANHIKQLNEKWNELAKNWITLNKPFYLNNKQVDTASDHIEVISIQAFFPQTSKKRFLDAHKSVDYILHALTDEIKSVSKEV